MHCSIDWLRKIRVCVAWTSIPREIDNFNLRRDLTKHSSLPLNRNLYTSMGHGRACFLQRVFVGCAKDQREQHDIAYQINREWPNNTSLPSTLMRRTLEIYTSSISSRVHLRDERQASVLFVVCKFSSLTDMCRYDREGCRACIDFPSLCQCKRAKVIVNCAKMRLTLTKLSWSEEDGLSASRMSLSLARLDIDRLVHQCFTSACVARWWWFLFSRQSDYLEQNHYASPNVKRSSWSILDCTFFSSMFCFLEEKQHSNNEKRKSRSKACQRS